MEVFLIYPKSEQAQKELAHELATEQKVELVDAVVKHLKEQA